MKLILIIIVFLAISSFSYSQGDNCNVVLKTYTHFHSKTQQEFIKNIVTHSSEYLSQDQHNNVSGKIDIAIPTESGVPIPLGISGGKDNINNQISQRINDYSRDEHFNFNQDLEYYILPESAYQNWIKCIEITKSSDPIQPISEFSPQGRTIIWNITLKPQSVPANITGYYITEGNGRMQNKINGLHNLRLTSGSPISKTYLMRDPNNSLQISILTDKYKPIIYYKEDGHRQIRLCDDAPVYAILVDGLPYTYQHAANRMQEWISTDRQQGLKVTDYQIYKLTNADAGYYIVDGYGAPPENLKGGQDKYIKWIGVDDPKNSKVLTFPIINMNCQLNNNQNFVLQSSSSGSYSISGSEGDLPSALRLCKTCGTR